MRNKYIFITLVCILIILFTSCPLQKSFDDQPSLFKGSTISICIPFVSENNTVSRTVIPSYSENFPVSQYEITATKGQESFTVFITNISSAEEQETKLNLVIAGVWELSIQGKNAEGTVVCKGNGTIEVSEAPYYEGRATVVLYPLTETGKGTLDLEVTMPDNTEVVISKVTLKNKTTDAQYTKTYDSTTFTISELDNEAGESVADFSSGVYDLQLELFSSTDMNEKDILYWKSETVYIWAGFITNKWIDHSSSASGSSESALILDTLDISLSDIAKTDTSFSRLEITETGEPSSYEPGDFVATTMRYTCADVPLTLSISVQAAQSVLVSNATGTNMVPCEIKKQSDGSYILGFDLPKYTENDYVNIEVTATNGIKKESYSLVYGGVYISNEGNDNLGNGTKSNPYNTIAQAFNSLPKKEDSDNTIILLTDLEEDNSFNLANGGNIKIASVGGNKTYTGQIKVEEKGNLTLQNITVDGGGVSDSASEAIEVVEGGTLCFAGTTRVTGGYVSVDNTGDTAENGAAQIQVDSTFDSSDIDINNNEYVALLRPTTYENTIISDNPIFTGASGKEIKQEDASVFGIMPVINEGDEESYYLHVKNSESIPFGYVTPRKTSVEVKFIGESFSSVVITCNDTFILGTTINLILPESVTLTKVSLLKNDGTEEKTSPSSSLELTGISLGFHELKIEGSVSSGNKSLLWVGSKTIKVVYEEKEGE